MRAHYHEWQNKKLFVKYKVIADKEEENIESSICTATGRITESCFVHESFEQRIEQIQKVFNTIFQNLLFRK